MKKKQRVMVVVLKAVTTERGKKMNKKSKRKNDLRTSIILLLLLLLLLISSTYAWFTANQTVTISTLDVKIEAENGLQISADGSNWKSILLNADIASDAAYSGNKNQIPTKMVPVSTAGATNTDGELVMFLGTVAADETTGDYQLTSTLETDAAGIAGNYIAFDIFLRVDADTELELSDASCVIMKDGSTDKGIKQASRVAFVIEGNTTVGDSLTNITGLNGGDTADVFIWEPNSNWHTAAAVKHASDTYSITTGESDTKAEGGVIEQGAVPYYGINSAISTPVILNKTNNGQDAGFTLVEPEYVTQSDEDGKMANDLKIFSLSAGITKVRVYMWVEGQDVDCENTASGTDISYNLQFQVAGTGA